MDSSGSVREAKGQLKLGCFLVCVLCKCLHSISMPVSRIHVYTVSILYTVSMFACFNPVSMYLSNLEKGNPSLIAVIQIYNVLLWFNLVMYVIRRIYVIFLCLCYYSVYNFKEERWALSK